MKVTYFYKVKGDSPLPYPIKKEERRIFSMKVFILRKWFDDSIWIERIEERKYKAFWEKGGKVNASFKNILRF